MKKQRVARVRVEKGYGPRHAFNAQEGSEAIPSPLPSVPQAPPDVGDKLRRMLIDQVISPEQRAEMAKNPAGLKALATYAGLAGIMMGGEEGGKLGEPGAVPSKVWGSWKPVKEADASGGSIRVDDAGNHYQYVGSHMTEEGGLAGKHVIVKPVEGPPPAGGTKWGKVPEGPYPLTVPDLTPEQQEFYHDLKAKIPDFEVQPDMTLKPTKGPTRWDYRAEVDPTTAAYDPNDPFTDAQWKQQQANLDAMTPEERQAHIERMLGNPPEPGDWWKQGGRPPSPEGMKRGKTKVGVAKGFGPRHAENAKEGDLTQVNTDTVPAMLTPREAVLNRNAAELAGRGNIEQLNSEGNQLAQKGVDLAARGQASVPPVKLPVPRVSGSGNVMKYVLPGTVRREAEAAIPKGLEGGDTDVTGKYEPPGYPLGWYLQRMWEELRGRKPHLDPSDKSTDPAGDPYVTEYRKERDSVQGQQRGTSDMKTKPKSTKGGPQPQQVPQYGRLPAPPQQQRGGFYPPGMGFAEGSPEVAGIGTPNPQKAYDPREQVDFKAPDLSGFIAALHKEGQRQGLSQTQMMGIAKEIAGGLGGGGGAPGGGSAPYDQLGGQYANFNVTQNATPFTGYQGGISDIGYPPFIMPNAEYHADKGSTWEGAYDPAYLVQRYQGGSDDVGFYGNRTFNPVHAFGGTGGPSRSFPINTQPGDPNQFPPDLPDIGRSQTPLLDQYDTQTANYYRQLQGGFGGFGNTPPAGTPGFPQGPTLHPGVFDAQGYPYAQPATPDQPQAARSRIFQNRRRA